MEETPNHNYSNENVLSPGADGTEVIWDQKSWLVFVEDCLNYVNSCDDPDPRIFRTERHVLRDDFGASPGFFCYLFKGNFLPSGDADGFVWKPSQSAKQSLGGNMMKRYFYQKDKSSGNSINRQVSWISGKNDWYMIEYKSHMHNAKITMSSIQSPEGYNWPHLVRTVYHYHKRKAPISPLSEPSNATSPVSDYHSEKRRFSTGFVEQKTKTRKREGFSMDGLQREKKSKVTISHTEFSISEENDSMDQLSSGALSISGLLSKEEDPFGNDYTPPQEQLSFPEKFVYSRTNPFINNSSTTLPSKEEDKEEDEYGDILNADLSDNQLENIYDSFSSSGVFPSRSSFSEDGY